MDFQTYLNFIEQTLKNNGQTNYEQDKLEYIKLNYSRIKRWLKTFEINNLLSEKVKNITQKQKWVLIVEPWCGDAANISPLINLISKENELINLEIQLRDSDSEIENYLTNGKKSIPILIIRDINNNDLMVWSSRPKSIQEKFEMLKDKGIDMNEIKKELQNWYNQDKGVSFQNELLESKLFDVIVEY